MNSKIKNWLVIILSLIFISVINTGCQTNSSGVASLKQETQLSKNGLISKKRIATIAGKNSYFDFNGKSNKIDYTWTYLGSQIHNPVTQKLSLATSLTNLTTIKKEAGNAPYALSLKIAKFNLAGQPTLTITLPEKWHANHVLVLTKQGTQLREIIEASPSITTTKHSTILTMKVSSTNIQVYLVAGQTSDKKLIAENTAAKTSVMRTGSKRLKKELVKQQTKANKNTTPKASSNSQKIPSVNDQTSKSKNNDSTGSSENTTAEDTTNTKEPNPTVTISIDCKTLVGHLGEVRKAKRDFVPTSGIILAPTTLEFTKGDSVYDLLVRATKKYGIQMEASYTPIYNSYYIEGINQLYEFDAGSLSGWMYNVNGWFPNYGVSAYNSLRTGDSISFSYTRNIGHDLGNN